MKQEQAYRVAIKKELEKVYNLGGKELIDIQASFVKELEKMFETWYTDALKLMRSNIEIQMNDWLLEDVKKTYSEEQLDEFNKFFEKSFTVGAKKLDLSTSKEPGVEVKLGLKQKDAEDYASAFAGKQITSIDKITTDRINKLVNHGISEGWGYNRIANVLKKDYAFSSYRANLIASHEVGEAYLNGKDTQFNRYRSEYGVDGWKQWASHRDDVTTVGCLHNDMQGWIPYSEEFESSGNKQKPTRFIGCRCNIVYNLFKPTDSRTTKKNVEPHMLEQTVIREDRGFDEGIKPDNYNNFTTSVLPASYFNEIGKKISYRGSGSGYYNKFLGVVNLGSQKVDIVKRKNTEVHEVGHFFFEEVVKNDPKKLDKFKDVIIVAVKEFKTLRTDKTLSTLLSHKYINRFMDDLYKNFDDIVDVTNFSKTVDVKTVKVLKESFKVVDTKASPTLRTQASAFMDTIASLTKSQYGAGHTKTYFKKTTRNPDLFKGFTDLQAHEFFAHMNEAHFIGNDITKAVMPETYAEMLKFYDNIGLSFK